MLPRSKKQKNDNEQVREDADALIKHAFVIQGRHGSKQEFCEAVQQSLARYQDLPNSERHIGDWVNIASAYLYIFDELGMRDLAPPAQQLKVILDQSLNEFNALCVLLASDEYAAVMADVDIRVTLACVRARILYCLDDRASPDKQLQLYETYCIPAQEVILSMQPEWSVDDIDVGYLYVAQFSLGTFYKSLGQLEMAKRSFLAALAGISTLNPNSGNNKFLSLVYSHASRIVAPYLDANAMHPLTFVKSIYNGTATYDIFSIVCEKVLSTQDRDPDLSRYFVQALGLIHKHLNSDILPDSNFQQHMQHEHFRAIFNDYRNRITARHMT